MINVYNIRHLKIALSFGESQSHLTCKIEVVIFTPLSCCKDSSRLCLYSVEHHVSHIVSSS